MAALVNEGESFQGVDGKPIVNGYIYIGTAGQDPTLNPKSIYSDRDLITALSNPQRTDAYGRSVNKIWTDGRYSIKVTDANGTQQLHDLQRGEIASSPTINLTNVQGINDVTADAVPAVSSYTDKAIYVLTVSNTNTDVVTLSFGAGAKDVTTSDGAQLTAGDWDDGSIQRVMWNEIGDRFEWLSLSTAEITASIAAIESEIDNISYITRHIGEVFEVWDDIPGCPKPDNSGAARFIKLSAGEDGVGDYNDGLLASESVSGSSPNIIATAVIDYVSSPMHGETVTLINTSRQFIRPGTSGVTQDDLLAAHAHTTALAIASDNGQYANFGGGSPSVVGYRATGSYGGEETRPRNIGATFYMRIA